MKGSLIINQSLCAYVRWALPYLPEEGVQAVVNFLTGDELLAHVSFHIGTLDLIMTVDYPPSPQILKKVFEAIIGALATSNKGTFLSEGTHTDVFVKSPKRRTFYFPELENLNFGDFYSCPSQPNTAFLPLQACKLLNFKTCLISKQFSVTKCSSIG